MTQDIEQYRAGFEADYTAWQERAGASDEYVFLSLLRNIAGEYTTVIAEARWQGWAAAKREASTEPSAQGFCLTDRGLSFPDGSHITPEGDVTGPLAHAMAHKINQTVAHMTGSPKLGRAALDEFCEKYCHHKPELVSVAESAFYWFNKCLASTEQQKDEATDAARYRAWRDQVVSGDNEGEFIEAIQDAFPLEVKVGRTPTAAEWDSGIDAAITQTKAKEGKS